MFEDVPGSFCGPSSSSSESMGLCFFAFGKSRGFFTSAVFFFPFCHCGLSFPCGDLELSLSRLCGSTAADTHHYFSAHVQVLVLAIWIFVVFRSYQSLHQVL